MANWESTITTIVRTLINDMAGVTFSDDRVQTAIVVAGLMVTQDFTFTTQYTFDLDTPDMSPDPVEIGDAVAVALFALKAACILSTNMYQSAIGRGIRVRDGDSEVDTTGSFKGYSDIMKVGPCAAYEKALKSVSFTNGFGRGKAVMSPVAYHAHNGGGIWNTRVLFDSIFY